MVKNKEENKECKEKTNRKNKGGYKELKDPLTEKAPRHQAAASENKDIISDEVAFAPCKDKKENEDTVTQEAVVTDFEKAEEIVPDKDEESVILRYKDSKKDNLLEKVFAYEKLSGITIPLDYDSDSESFLVSVKKSEIDEFRPFMKDFEEIPFSGETADNTIKDVQSRRSNRAIAIDKSITASRVGDKQNPIDLKDWVENPNTLDLLGVDDGEV